MLASTSPWPNGLKILKISSNIIEYTLFYFCTHVNAVDDASGHYSTGYFWGNNYWTGSMSLCRSIFKTSATDEFTRKESSNIGLTFLHGNTGGSQIKHQNPPFLPRFSVIKLAFNDSFTTPNVRVFISSRHSSDSFFLQVLNLSL